MFLLLLFLDLKGAEISSMCLTRLSPLTLQVKWQMESQSHSEVYYEVYLDNNVAVRGCRDTNAEIEVEPGTTYSLKIVTCFTIDGQQYSRESEVKSYESPPQDYCENNHAFTHQLLYVFLYYKVC